MNSEVVRKRWLDFNVNGKGRDTFTAGSYWFRGPVLYYNSSPSMRVVSGVGGKVALVKHVGLSQTTAKPFGVKVITAIDLGVFSQFSGDWLDEGASLNDRVRFILLSAMRHIIDEVVPRTTGQSLGEQGRGSSIRGNYRKLVDQYDAYRMFVGTNWPNVPSIYKEQLDELIESRINAYQDPKAVAARERAAARKVAMKTLGIDKKSKAA